MEKDSWDDAPAVVEGYIDDYRLRKTTGTLIVHVELDEIQTQKFHSLFNPAHGSRVAIARLKHATPKLK